MHRHRNLNVFGLQGLFCLINNEFCDAVPMDLVMLKEYLVSPLAAR